MFDNDDFFEDLNDIDDEFPWEEHHLYFKPGDYIVCVHTMTVYYVKKINKRTAVLTWCSWDDDENEVFGESKTIPIRCLKNYMFY